MRFNDIPVLILAKPANDILVGHLGAQTAGGRLVPVDPVCEDTSASAFPATQPLYETCYGRFWRYAKIGQIFIAQKHFCGGNGDIAHAPQVQRPSRPILFGLARHGRRGSGF